MLLQIPRRWLTSKTVLFAVDGVRRTEPIANAHFAVVPVLRWWARPLVWFLILRYVRAQGRPQ